MEERFDVVFDGSFQDGLNREEVRENLIRLFNGNNKAIDTLLNRSRAFIKRNIDREKAQKYKTTLEQCGVVCRIAPSVAPDNVQQLESEAVPAPDRSSPAAVDNTSSDLRLQTSEEDNPAGDGPEAIESGIPAVPNETCAECGRRFAKDEMIPHNNSWICAACKPVFVQKMKEGVSLSSVMRYGGFWIRFGAKLIDGFIMAGVNFVMNIAATPFLMAAPSETTSPSTMMAAPLLLALLQIMTYAGYGIFFLGRFSATPGKMLCRLKVVTTEGEKITYSRASGRFFSEFLSAILLYIGYLMAAFDSEKRALHDKICGTRVIRV